MKKKILSLILVLMMLPIASLFSACGKDGYNLDKLSTSFKEIVTNNSNVAEQDEFGFVFDYSNHENLNYVVNEVYPYTELNDYNQVFNNLMQFSFEYVDDCSDNDVTDDAELKNEIEKNLKNLKDSVHAVNECVNMLAEIINISNVSNALEKVCLTRYENLLSTYDELFVSAINFNDSLSELYYNHVLKDGNPNVFENVGGDYQKNKNKFDANLIINKINGRLKFQIANLTKNYLETYVLGGKLAEDVASCKTDFNLNVKNYRANVNAINKHVNESVAIEMLNSETKLQKFYELSVQAYNIQETIKNDNTKVTYACNSVEYVQVSEKENATAFELMCLSIIDSNYNLISTYNQVLVEMLTMITGV